MTKKILVVDDEPAQLRLAEQVLKSNGYQVIVASSGQVSLRMIVDQKPDLVLLDVMMPGIDGWQTCSCIRELTDIPIIMLTGKRTGEDDIVRGLECGADEYLTKPVGNRELLARVRSALRRAEQPSYLEKKKKTVYSDGYLVVDVEERKVEVNGARLKLTPREFRLLALLVENANRVLSHQQLLENVWGWEYIDDVDYVRIYISHLRQKIEHDTSRPKYILTEPGVGYSFHKIEQ
ncbi:MAG TPA: response regulator transcription factor [Dehalococcoidia bacterium]|nr:response regulator transcription factor [Dehalococcoidia bacterium]